MCSTSIKKKTVAFLVVPEVFCSILFGYSKNKSIISLIILATSIILVPRLLQWRSRMIWPFWPQLKQRYGKPITNTIAHLPTMLTSWLPSILIPSLSHCPILIPIYLLKFLSIVPPIILFKSTWIFIIILKFRGVILFLYFLLFLIMHVLFLAKVSMMKLLVYGTVHQTIQKCLVIINIWLRTEFFNAHLYFKILFAFLPATNLA